MNKTAIKVLGIQGRMIGHSKSIYTYDNPKHLVIFNANIIHPKLGKIWYGDLDLTLDSDRLKELSKRLKSKIYILYESDARFNNETSPKIDNAVAVYTKNSMILKESNFYYLDKKGTPKKLTDKEYEKKFPSAPSAPKLYNKLDYTPISLPDLETLKAKKGFSFLEQLELWFVKKYGREGAQELYKNLWLTPKYYEALEKKERKAIKAAWPYIHPVKLDQSLMMSMLNAPCSFENKPDWAKDDKGYIKIKD